jgi:hypothetical protein
VENKNTGRERQSEGFSKIKEERNFQIGDYSGLTSREVKRKNELRVILSFQKFMFVVFLCHFLLSAHQIK